MSPTHSYVEVEGEKVSVRANGSLEVVYASIDKISDIKGLNKLQGLKSLVIESECLSSIKYYLFV